MADANRVNVTINNIEGAGNTLNTAAASIGFLVGDFNNTRNVNNTDITAAKTRLGRGFKGEDER